MAKKFDTNPLDPDFPEKARAAAVNGKTVEQETVVLPNGYAPGKFSPGSVTEDETRKFADADFRAYSYSNAQPATIYGPTHQEVEHTSRRRVENIGLPENVLTALSYVPFWIGLIAGLIQLLILPKTETKVRFHAAQGLAAHIAIFLVGAVLEVGDGLIPLAGAVAAIFWIVTSVMLIVFAVKAWKGKPVHIESVDDLTNWLEEKLTLNK